MTICWPICIIWWVWVSGDNTMQIWGLHGLTAILTLVSQSGLRGALLAPTPEELGLKNLCSRLNSGLTHRSLAWYKGLGQNKELRLLLFSLDPTLPFSLPVSDSIYVFYSFLLLFSFPLYLFLSLGLSPSFPKFQTLFLFLAYPFCFSPYSLSFSIFFHIPVSLPLLLDLYGHVSWSQLFPVLFSFPSQNPQGLIERISCCILSFLSRRVRDGDLGLNLNFLGLGGASNETAKEGGKTDLFSKRMESRVGTWQRLWVPMFSQCPGLVFSD